MYTSKHHHRRDFGAGTTIAFLSIVLLNGCAQDSFEDESVQNESSEVNETTTADSLVRNRVKESLPTAAFKPGQTVSKTSEFIGRDPLVLAEALSPKRDFELTEVRENGRTVYRSQSGNEILKVDKAKGYMKYIENGAIVDSKSVQSPIGAERARENARQFFAELGLPEDEVADVEVAPVMAVDTDENNHESAPMMIAQMVHFNRNIDGMEVFDSFARMFLDLEGKPFRAHVQWPEFRLAEQATALTDDSVVNDVARVLQERLPANHGVRRISSRQGYLFNEETLTFEPAVRTLAVWEADDESASGTPFTPFTEDVTYSLLRGVID